MKSKALRVAVLAVWSALVTVLTFVLGGALLRALRVYAGENLYWLISLLITSVFIAVGWEAYALVYFGSVLLIGVFSDLEERGVDYFKAGLVSLTMVGLAGGGIFALWMSQQGPGWFEGLVTQIETPILKVFPAKEGLPLQIGDVLRQAPSLIVMLYVFSLLLALLLEKRLLKSVGGRAPIERNLIEFKVPDIFIWVLIPSIYGTFGQIENTVLLTISVNIFNICLLLYFLQGMAVAATFFKQMKMSPLWQTVLMVFMAVQLFVFVSVVGVVDYWADFRKKMKSRPAKVNKQIYRNK